VGDGAVIPDPPSLAEILGPPQRGRLANLQRELAALRRRSASDERETLGRQLCEQIRWASAYDPQAPCPNGCGESNSHERTKRALGKERTEGDTLCPRVQRTRRKGDPGVGENRHAVYFRPPTQVEIARWDAEDEKERRKALKSASADRQDTITGAR
jgi:hypothetical protein